MRIPSRGRQYGLQLQMTPLIDIVFLLLIFFLVASYLSNAEVESGIALAKVPGGEQDQTSEARRLIVTVQANGKWEQAGKPLSREGFAALLAEAPVEERGQLEVRLRIDERTPYESLEPLLQECARLNVTQIKFHVLQGGK